MRAAPSDKNLVESTPSTRPSVCEAPDNGGRHAAGYWAAQAFLVILCVVILLPSLKLPWSIVDEPHILYSSKQFYDRLSRFEIVSALRALVVWEGLADQNTAPNFGPALGVAGAIQWILFGGWAPGWHLAKMLMFCGAALGLFHLGLAARMKLRAAVLGAAMFAIFNPGEILQDIQAHVGNWFRLFTSDSYQVLFGIWQAYFFLRLLQDREDRGNSWWEWAIFSLTGMIAWLSKISALHTIGPFIALLGIRAFALKRVDAKSLKILAALMIPWMIGCLYFRPSSGTQIGTYQWSFKFEPRTYWEGIVFYSHNLLDAFGVVPFLSVAIILYRLFAPRWSSGQKRGMSLALLLAIGAFTLQCVWPWRLPRYMIVFTPYWMALSGWAIEPLIFFDYRKDPARKFQIFPWLLSVLAGVSLWTVALYPLVFNSDQVLTRYWLMGIILGLCFLNFIAMGMAIYGKPRFQTPLSWRWWALPLALFQGHFIHHAASCCVSIQDFSTNYSAWCEANKEWMNYLLNEMRRNPAKPLRIAFAPPYNEYPFQIKNAAATLAGAGHVEGEAYNKQKLPQVDYLISNINTNHPLDAAFIPKIYHGHEIQVYSPQKGDHHIGIAPGLRWRSRQKSPKDMTILGVALLGDNSSWHPDLAVNFTLQAGDQTAYSRIRGVQASRLRGPAPPFLFDQPIHLNKDQTFDVLIEGERPQYGWNPENLKKADLAAWAYTEPSPVCLLKGKPTKSAPVLTFLEASPLPASFQRVHGAIVRKTSHILSSPYSIMHYFVKIWAKGWSRDFQRPVEYTYITEVYRNIKVLEKSKKDKEISESGK